MSVSSSVLYERKPKALKVSSQRLSLQPIGGSTAFSAGNTIEFMIPTMRVGEYLDPAQTTIKYRVRNVGTGAGGVAAANENAVRLDHNGACVIRRMQIYNSSNQVEDIDLYNVLYSAMIDAQVNTSDLNSLSSAWGLSATSLEGPRGAPINVTSAQGINMPIASSLIGLMATKYLPLCKLSSPLRVLITLETNSQALVYSSAGGTVFTNFYRVEDVELQLGIVSLGDTAQALVDQTNASLGPEIVFASKQFAYYPLSTISATAGFKTFQIDARYASVNGLIFLFRNTTAHANREQCYNLSSRVNIVNNRFQLRLGSQFIPSKEIDLSNDISEAWTETQKYFMALNSLNMYGSPTATDYVKQDGAIADAAAANATWGNKFLLAINTEAYHQKGDQLFDGISSINDSFYLNVNTLALTNAVVGDCFVNYDVLFTINESGILSRAF